MPNWTAGTPRADASKLLHGSGHQPSILQYKLMSEPDAQAEGQGAAGAGAVRQARTSFCWTSRPTTWTSRPSSWLEDFLLDFPSTVIVVSHDRHFLNKVCTHIVDIDFGKIQMYVGNYDFWYESSQMVRRAMHEGHQTRRTRRRSRNCRLFIQRFSGQQASKHKQATSRKKLLDNLTNGNTLTPSSRRVSVYRVEAGSRYRQRSADRD